MKLWQKTTVAIALLLAGGAVLGRNIDVQAAEQRLQRTLGQLDAVASAPYVDDVRAQPHIPPLKLTRPKVPEASYYGDPVHDNMSVDPLKIADHYRPRAQPNTKLSEGTDLLVFVSFSIPEVSLKRIAVETAKAGGVMVLRGFKDNSLKHTIHAVEEVAALQGDLLIHPDLFDHYQITEVPTTVLAKAGDEASCGSNAEDDTGLCTAHYQVKGDVSLHAALEYFLTLKHDSELDAMAQAKLAKLRGQK